MATTTKAVKKSAGRELFDTVVVIVEALIIALVFRTFLYQPFSIPTASMQSTMMIGDYFVASKFTWGYGPYSFPFPIPGLNQRIFGRDPNRGDVAVFRPVPQQEDYIKRVIGLPGDTIEMREGRLYINGTMVEREEIGRGVDRNDSGQEVPVILYRETLPPSVAGGEPVTHVIQEISDNAPLDNAGPFVVPAGHFFMMGDNRDRSADSRVLSAVGYVPAANLIGKAEATFFSITDNIAPLKIW